jgi:hypothetical protein
MTIHSRTPYELPPGPKGPWEIPGVETTTPGEVHIRVALPGGMLRVCPQCGCAAPDRSPASTGAHACFQPHASPKAHRRCRHSARGTQ